MFIENPVPWPGTTKCALSIKFDLDADSVLPIAQPDKADTYVLPQSNLRYGPEVSIPRICKIDEHFGIRQTFFVPGWCVERYPRAHETILRDGHEIGHQGYLREPPNQQSAEDERYWFKRALNAYDRCLGIRPSGYRVPLNESSKKSLCRCSWRRVLSMTRQ
ncbi:MAG: polysaccharide deacetylase family protein [Rhodospirillales bacterium]